MCMFDHVIMYFTNMYDYNALKDIFLNNFILKKKRKHRPRNPISQRNSPSHLNCIGTLDITVFLSPQSSYYVQYSLLDNL